MSQSRSTTRKDVVPNQIFIGCPWKITRAKYEKMIASMRKRYPLSFVIVGRDDSQEADDLLTHIKEKLLGSSYAIFDATGGNANVSLEFGIAEANEIPRALYISEHGAVKKKTKEAPIISDLAGKRRNVYKNEKSLSTLLSTLARSHSFTKQFENFMQKEFRKKSKGYKKRVRALSLKVIHCLDGVNKIRRSDLVQRLIAENLNYNESEVDNIIILLHRNDLIISDKGRYSTVRMI